MSFTMPETIVCPIECVKSGCDDPPDWLQKHNAFLLTLIASLSACVGIVLTYFLKSRCKNIKTPCVSCDRDVLVLEPQSVEVSTVPPA